MGLVEPTKRVGLISLKMYHKVIEVVHKIIYQDEVWHECKFKIVHFNPCKKTYHNCVHDKNMYTNN